MDGDKAVTTPDKDATDNRASVRADLTDDELAEFVAERMPGGKCEMCGTDKWIGLKEVSPGFVPALTSVNWTEQKGAPHPVFPCFLMVCSNCGNTKIIARRVIGDWKIARDANGRT